ncbi:MAG TPA: hypothetical protein VGB37_14815 [Candidatus Lokiarchaeia archaeon]
MKVTEKIQALNNIVIIGIVNGLSHTHTDGRTEDINFWKLRSELFNEFFICVKSLLSNQNYSYAEKRLIEIAQEGYKK